MEWYEELDYDENPLKIETKTVGNEGVIDEIFYSILSGNMLFLEGAEGMGKTKILGEIIKKFGGRRKIIYVNCRTLQAGLNMEKLLVNRNGILGKIFKRKPKNMILLLDEIEFLSKTNRERIKYYFDQNYLRSVIFSSRQFENVELGESIKERLSKVVKVESLSDYEAVQLIHNKIGSNLLSERLIKEVYKLSNKNPQMFLNNCNKVCSQAIKNPELKEDDVQSIVSSQEVVAQ